MTQVDDVRGEFYRSARHEESRTKNLSPTCDVAFKKRPHKTADTSGGEIPNARFQELMRTWWGCTDHAGDYTGDYARGAGGLQG